MNLTQLSRTLSHALRHEPWVYELELDDEGWVSLATLISALKENRSRWQDLTEDHVHRMMAAADKQRYQVTNGKIRALYGHSIPERLTKEPAAPPEILYHGTAPATAEIILRDGLQPMARQYVHLSADRETAENVGQRKSGKPVILRVRASEAAAQRVPFYVGNDKVWLADTVPGEFIAVE